MLYVDSMGGDDQIKDNINANGQFDTNPNCILHAHYLCITKRIYKYMVIYQQHI